MTVLKFVLYISLLNLGSIAAVIVCDPFLDCKTEGIGGVVPDPLNCEGFYGCINNGSGSSIPSTIPLQCPGNQYFDAYSLECLDETTPDHCTTDLCTEIRGKQCLAKCPTVLAASTADLLLAADPDDCSKYYICTSTPVEVACLDPTPYFNGSDCVAEAYKCCDLCTPYCYEVGTQVPDPYDCAAFYICLTTGPVNPDYRVVCDTGLCYDAETLSCIESTDTTPICK